jgi:PAS domain S-box-containing protein
MVDDFDALPFLGSGERSRLSESFVHEGQFVCVAVRNDGTIVYITESVRNQLGYEPAELVGTNILHLIHPDDMERALLQLSSAVGGRLISGITRFQVLNKSGSYGPLEVFGGPVSDGSEELIGIYARDPLHQVVIEDILAMLLRGLPPEEVLVPVCDVIQWREHGSHLAISWEDNGLHNVSTGLPPLLFAGGEPLQSSPWAFVDTVDPQGTDGQLTDLPEDLASAARSMGLEMWWVTGVKWSDVRPPALITVWTRGGLITPNVHSYGLGVAHNMVQLILAWGEAQDRRIARRKLEFLGAMSAGIAHEIRNPLNFIVNFAQIGEEESRDDPGDRAARSPSKIGELAGYFETIGKHAARIDRIVTAVLNQSERGNLEAKVTNLSELVTRFATVGYQGFLGAGHYDFEARLHIVVPEKSLALVYPQELGRVLINLVENACASMYERRSIEPDPPPDLQIELEDLDDAARVRVRDNGKGIAEALRERVFEPFFTTKDPDKGTGLGLAICHQIVVDLHGGEISVESHPGRSTTFEFTIPKAISRNRGPSEGSDNDPFRGEQLGGEDSNPQ